ncbi:Methenyltetrahydromethanopterin cyclohydrolase [Posidoniimonas polymericola]|uniref:Methenyltetrahydromethanopterin cyclohydrolase n=1 Tax=Posidoniimonas polymericola TaxID=2528002 RepID=A0A5C5YU15_9BACT|nr:methenyltetrahydromethanopterin cyclohydrolase [Posidoniimonas polymericola]TWT78246.1 Methenyltetrahydromethanopterin cyclohydrolase [Posidoniimonas polymericola]
MTPLSLNHRALTVADQIAADALRLRVDVSLIGGARVIDCGASAAGGLEAGRLMAEASMAGLGSVSIGVTRVTGDEGPAVVVRTDHPVAACMAAQYAGWEVKAGGYFAMGSGPMRAAAGREELFATIGHTEQAEACLGLLETDQPPTAEVCAEIAHKCGVPVDKLTLLYAPTNSTAGSLQVVARSIETALHKLHELGFDLSRVASAWGVAPLPPVAGDTLSGIGRTNDAILYGGQAVLHVRGDDESLAAIAPRLPSGASPDHGRPFAEVFAAYDHDFYQIDKLLFSPARATLVNLDTGRSHSAGDFCPDVLRQSFGLA